MNAKVFALAAAAHRMGMMTGQARGPRSSTLRDAGAAVDPHDVLAQLIVQPVAIPVATGTPIDALVPDRVGRRSIVTFEGASESNKTGLLLAAIATRLKGGDDVVLHVADRDALVAARRLASLVGVSAEKLASTFPRLRVRNGPLAESIARVTPGSTFALDSLQAARDSVQCRADAADYERTNQVLRHLRALADRDVLVLATVEMKNGQPRFSASTSFESDVRIACERDNDGRYSVEVTKPAGRGLRWYTLRGSGEIVDCTAGAQELSVSQFVAHEHTTRARRPGKRRARNRPARTPEDIARDVRAYLADHPGASMRQVQAHVVGNHHVIRAAVRRLRTETTP